jgi:DNA-directed RNA polymerase I subunit RPA1
MLSSGATAIEHENGFRKMIDGKNPVQREALAKTLLTPADASEESSTKYVHRHLVTGDAMLLNRQPTLHKPSIMSHRSAVRSGAEVSKYHEIKILSGRGCSRGRR